MQDRPSRFIAACTTGRIGEIRAVLGKLITQAGTVHIERVNALTRKIHAFAKCDATWDALVHLQFFEHNWIRPHQALRLPMNGTPQPVRVGIIASYDEEKGFC